MITDDDCKKQIEKFRNESKKNFNDETKKSLKKVKKGSSIPRDGVPRCVQSNLTIILSGRIMSSKKSEGIIDWNSDVVGS